MYGRRCRDGLRAGDRPEGTNCLHVGFRPDDPTVEIDRIVARGGRKIDIARGVQPWTGLADPAGNEFCIPGARKAVPTTDVAGNPEQACVSRFTYGPLEGTSGS
ncbi:VOC family protein [Arthrobacter sp. MDT3-44]